MSKNKAEMTDNLKIGENRIEDIRNPDGTFKKGTQIGRMKKKGFSITDLTKVAMEYDKTHDLTILEHYIEQLFVDNRLLDKFIDRYVPPKNISELTGKDGQPIGGTQVIYLTEKIYKMCPLRLQCPIEKEVCEAERLRVVNEAEKQGKENDQENDKG